MSQALQIFAKMFLLVWIIQYCSFCYVYLQSTVSQCLYYYIANDYIVILH